MTGKRRIGETKIKLNCAFRLKHNRERVIFTYGCILFGLSVLLQALARKTSFFGPWYARTIYPFLTGSIGRFFGLFPFSASELLLYLLLFFSLFYGITRLTDWKWIVNRAFLLTAALFFLYTVNCGINYYHLPFSYFSGFETAKYSTEELKGLCLFLTERLNQAEEKLHSLPDYELLAGAKEYAEAGKKAMELLGEEYPSLSGFYPKPKKLLFSRLLSVQQLSGIYSPFTIEANYNGEMTAYNIPVTICHELSHLRGFMREDEANFIGFLACIGSENLEFQYSGYMMGWIYAGNALAKEDFEAYAEYYSQLNSGIREDFTENNLFWRRFDTHIAKAADAVNDAYLKANNQEQGVKSYGRAVDLLLSWHQKQSSVE